MKAPGRTAMQAAELSDMLAQAKLAADGYAPRVVASDLLSVGLYTLPAGAVDDQSPHQEDEVYYTVRGRARFTAGAEDRAVQPGTLLFVPARMEHRFHDITEELVLIVFWAPPEDSVAPEQEVNP